VLEGLRQHPEEVARRRQLAAERARERYDWERVADGYAALLRRLAGG
jgi:glycosyltransferase involved in cell wall biosynthesis